MVLRQIINYILPPRCLFCFDFTTYDDGFCGSCFSKFDFITKPYCLICGFRFTVNYDQDLLCGRCSSNPPDFDKLRSLYKFDEYSKKIIHNFKYHDKTGLAKIFAKLFYNRYKDEFHDIDIVIFVPMHWLKRLFRMYNQSHLLAREIANKLNKPLVSSLLNKTNFTKSQTFLSKVQREQNIKNSIRYNNKYDVRGMHILLVDDVTTTRTTINECSKILKKAGAIVSVFTIATT
ncbi:MAG: ComF family protein [Rickettsiaceae bacterium]